MPEYRVTWEIDVQAEDAEAAARRAREIQQAGTGSIATVFTVEHRAPMIARQPTRTVDLSAIDNETDGQECARCDDIVGTVSSDGLCDGCVAEDAAVQETSP